MSNNHNKKNNDNTFSNSNNYKSDKKKNYRKNSLIGIIAAILVATGAFTVNGNTDIFGSNTGNNAGKTTVTKQDNRSSKSGQSEKSYTFRYHSNLTDHYKKHGIEMGFKSEEEYLAAANALINDPEAKHKLEAEDNDHIYYLEATNEIAFVSQDGYIRSYFICSGYDYYKRQ
ncbi:MAG: hypothetical protein K6D02_07775 [Lachnospiraceae bacterium]|nr:hypothetical protein [Lachnospiraceae bacterium]